MPRKVAKLKADAAPGGAGQQHKQEEAGQPPQQGPAAAGAPGAAAPAAGAKPKTPRKESAGARGAAAEGGPAGHHHAKLDVQEVLKRRHELLEALKLVERQIHNLESDYFKKANTQGNALRGYDGLMSTTAVNAKKARFKEDTDRIFSGSSLTGPAAAPQ